MHACSSLCRVSLAVSEISRHSQMIIPLLCSSQMTDHQRRRSNQPQPQPQQPPPPQKSTLVPVSLGPHSVQILNYEASLLQQQVY